MNLNNKQGSPVPKSLNFFEAVHTCLKKYADFSGRASKSEYWWWVLFEFLFVTFFYVFFAMIRISAQEHIGAIISIPFILLPGLAVGVRRLHDIGKSGWYIIPMILLSFVYGLGLLWTIIWFTQDSKPENNDY